MKKSGMPSSPPRQSALNAVHDQKREHILDVAEHLFFTRGFSGTTIADIVAQLGVTKPYLYYYFPSKNAIFETLCLRASEACLTAMRFAKDDDRSATGKLHVGLHRFATANIRYFKAGTFAYRDPAALQPDFMKKLKTMARRFYRELGGLLDQGKQDGALDFDNTSLTGLAIGSIAGFMYTWYKPDGRIDPEEMVAQLLAILLRIAGKRPVLTEPVTKKVNRQRA